MLKQYVCKLMGWQTEFNYYFQKPENRSRLGLKTNVENDVFRSKWRSGYGEPGSTHRTRIPKIVSREDKKR